MAMNNVLDVIKKVEANSGASATLEEDVYKIQKASRYGVLNRTGRYSLVKKEVLETVKDPTIKYGNGYRILQG